MSIRALLLLVLMTSTAWADRTLRLVVAVEPAAALDETVDAVGRRLEAWGIGKATRQGDELVVDAAGLRDDEVETVERLVLTRGRLEVAPVTNRSPLMATIAERLAAHPAPGVELVPEAWITEAGVGFKDRYLMAKDGAVTGRQRLEAFLREAGVDATPIVYEAASEAARLLVGNRPPSWRTYVIDPALRMTLSPVRATPAMYVRPVIEVVLDKPGTMRVAAVTATRVGSKLAILIDGQVSSAPLIMGPIALGNITVAPDPVGTLEERVARARALAIILASPLPATTVVRSRKVDAQSPPADDAVACEQGAADACDRACAAAPARCAAIAAPLVSGPTRRQNHSVALVLAERGCDGGDMAACGLAGAIHLEGMLPDHDLARAHVLLAKACAKGLALACTAKRSLVEQVRAVCDSDSDSAALYCDYLVQIDPAHAARTRKRQKVLEKKNGKWLDELEKQMKAQEKLEKEP